MNGEDLVYDYRFNVVDEPTEWAFNWDYSECGTSDPTPREHHCTMWMVMNDEDPVGALKKLFKQLGRPFPVKLKLKEPCRDEEDGGDDRLKLVAIHKTSKDVLFRGEMAKPNADSPDPNVGNYTVFRSTTKYGTTLMKKIVENTAHGRIACILHKRLEVDLEDGYRVVVITGEEPDASENDYDTHFEGLSTRFSLFHEDEEVARCLMSYRDGSYDSSMGPTIEMIAVKQSRRGEGLAKVLWHWILWFVNKNFTVECLNNDAPLGHVMVKATQIANQEVEMRRRRRDKQLWPVGFKELLFDYCGFSVRVQKGAMGFLFGSRRPKDEEGVLYIPLLPRNQLPTRLRTEKSKSPKPGDGIMRTKCGTRMCLWCTNIDNGMLRCSKCETTIYCNAQCQKNDWKRHKKWCGKTREEVKERLIKEGGLIRGEDGVESLVMNPNL